jgi:hypothetical protein
MVRLTVLVLLCLGCLAGAATASVTPWKPGSPFFAKESEMNDLAETKYDHAYCNGVPRFGHHGEFPYEQFIVFDCTTTLDDTTCFGRRYKTVKHTLGGTFTARLIKSGHCY